MQSIQQMVTGASQVAHSATTVSNGLTRARAHVSQALASSSAAGTATVPAAPAGSGSPITANDFLTLLVTEMKNQDPTQPTDPNAYIQQLVQVNSLQQLIGINQGITSLNSTAGGGTGGSSSTGG